MNGDAQGDVISGFENLVGSNFNDTLTGSLVANVISGYGGNDTIIGGAGADTINGGTGEDTLMYWGSPTGVAVDLAAGTGFGGDAAGDLISFIENLNGTFFADTLLGDANVNELYGHDGMDMLNGRGGADQMHGGTKATPTTSTMCRTRCSRKLAKARIRSIAASATRWRPVRRSRPWPRPMPPGVGAINLTGNDVAQTITGNAGANIINGGGGADTMQGLGGDDMYFVDNAADAVDRSGRRRNRSCLHLGQLHADGGFRSGALQHDQHGRERARST